MQDQLKFRIAMQACAGPGKSCVLAWLCWWFLACFGGKYDHPQGAAVSMSKDNLQAGLWKEIAKWQKRSPMLTEAFKWTASAVRSVEHPETWFFEARAWPKRANPEEQGDTLSGIHGPFIMFLIDEGGSIPPVVLQRAEQAAGDPEGMCWICTAGNPVSKTSLLYRCSRDRQNWHVTEITADPDDPERTHRVTVEHARKQIETYGETSAWTQAYIYGRFPDAAINQLLTIEQVTDAMERGPPTEAFDWAPKILGVDVAAEGLDLSCIFPRQGIVAFKPTMLAQVTDVEGAGWTANIWRDWGADACFVDDGGGFGSGWISRLKDIGFRPTPVQFGGMPNDKHYANKRSEMYWRMREWVLDGGSLPNVPELIGELTEPTYSHRALRGTDALQMEPKDLIKARLGRSPDRADALALTFAQPVASKPNFRLDPMDPRHTSGKAKMTSHDD